MLARKGQIPDAQITEKVSQLIASRGLRSPCKVTVRTVNGDVTLSGTVQHGHQKLSAVQMTRGIGGVRRVIDQLVVQPMKKY